MSTKRTLCEICSTNEAVEGDTLCEECIEGSREYPYQEATALGYSELSEEEYLRIVERESWYDWQGHEE